VCLPVVVVSFGPTVGRYCFHPPALTSLLRPIPSPPPARLPAVHRSPPPAAIQPPVQGSSSRSQPCPLPSRREARRLGSWSEDKETRERMQQLQPKQMHWVRADSSDFGGDRPAPRSGHTAVIIGKSKVVVFGGFADKRFLADVSVYDVENKLWYTPECTGNGSDGQAGPSPRAFHIAVVIDCNMFIFGGRSGV